MHNSTEETYEHYLHQNLKLHLKYLDNGLSFYETLDYSLFPTGKLFRPRLALALYCDLTRERNKEMPLLNPQSPLSLICSALEIHHCYSLIHDDLPCMDNDDYRRGKFSTHKKYGQWQAILAGDALLHHGHTLIGKISNPRHFQLRQIFNWALGAKGLILGQVFDLSGLMNKDFSSLLRTHELKTGRLIQTSLLAGAWASSQRELSFREIKNYLRLGSSLGICFQLFDDLDEATRKLTPHEKEVNPFLRFPKESFHELQKKKELIANNLKRFPSLESLIRKYFKKMESIIEKDLKNKDGLLLKQIASSQDLNELLLSLIKN